ncbi:MAG: thioredoxin domain-containing protein [Planctomycetota bacterium]|jgi:uncharacterized protein YyaL (SSP411 family)|nr:thioredoxin domain-containing protein [Planctomycetota bacterium]
MVWCAVGLLLVLCVFSAQASEIHLLGSAAQRAKLPPDGGEDFNRLIHSASPYLLQHAANPVDWYPWGDEAFARARAENKLVFLSVGYSTCHWCHVMARESFEDEAVAALLKEYFIAVKLDREERPDIDHVYMSFVQATTGRGGWPMTVFLTPEGKPLFGGTYFPKQQFVELLNSLVTAWRDRRDEMVQAGERLTRELTAMTAGSDVAAKALESDLDAQVLQSLREQYDAQEGGFGPAPKFPRPAQLLPLGVLAAAGADDAEAMWLHTVRAMHRGGMYDHIGGGFHRYSVDRFWHVPHFEKMLYDQGQLAVAYVDAWQHSGDAELLAVAQDICRYVLRDLRHSDGGLYSAEDADSARPDAPKEHGEGAFYVWTADELRELLGDDFTLAATRFGIGADGNIRPASDPHGELAGMNHLYLAADLAAVAQDAGLDVAQAAERLEAARAAIEQARDARPRPHRDDKVLTAWNGLMISGLACTGAAAGDPALIAAAQDAVAFIKRELYDAEAGQLYRVWREGQRGETTALADDHAYLVQGLLDLYRATGDAALLRWARDLQAQMDARFAHPDGGWYNSEAGRADVLLRAKEDYDGAEPAASSVAARNCLRLGRLLGDDALVARGEQAIRACGILARAPQAAPAMVFAQQLAGSQPRQLVVVVPPGASAQALLAVLAQSYQPMLDVLVLDGTGADLIGERPWIAAMTAIDSKPTAYLCQGTSCQAPTTDPGVLQTQLGF